MLSHIKLTNGDDIIAIVTDVDEDNETITLEHPLQFIIDPSIGTYGRKYLAFSEQHICKLDAFHVLFINKASESAAQLYLDIIARSASDVDNELEFFDEATATLH